MGNQGTFWKKNTFSKILAYQAYYLWFYIILGPTLSPQARVVAAGVSSATSSSDMTPDSGIRSALPIDSGTNSGLESEVL